eukprot:Skav215095  [mRNA]  locus=scaffold1068:133552:140131:+ [translate_table: standard]
MMRHRKRSNSRGWAQDGTRLGVSAAAGGAEFYLITSGTARVWVRSGDDEQEYVWGPGHIRSGEHWVRLHAGNLFGERALLKNEPRAASVTAVTEARLRGSFGAQPQQYLTDPRKLIADFYQDAIAKMLSGAAVGKGLNASWHLVEYSWAFNSSAGHRSSEPGLRRPPEDQRERAQVGDRRLATGFTDRRVRTERRSNPQPGLHVAERARYYKTKAAREEARKAMVWLGAALQAVLDTATTLKIESRSIADEERDSYKPDVQLGGVFPSWVRLDPYPGGDEWGLEMPEPLMREER